MQADNTSSGRRAIPLESLRAFDEKFLEILCRLSNEKVQVRSAAEFSTAMHDWLKKHPGLFLPLLKELRELLLQLGKEHDIKNTEDFPDVLRLIFEEAATGLGASLVHEVNEIIAKRLRRANDRERIEILEDCAGKLDAAIDYFFDLPEEDRNGWLSFAEPLRADCWRAAQNLRRKLR